MRSESLERIFQRDLDRLPALTDAELLPRPRARQPGLGGIAAMISCVLLAFIIVLSARATRDEQATQQMESPDTEAYYITDIGVAASTSSNSATIAPIVLSAAPTCPAGQLPWIAVSHPPPPGSEPGTGASSAEIAFRRANPSITEFTMYPWGARDPAQAGDPRLARGPVWIVAGSVTFIAQAPGGPADANNWFAYPAQFMGCRMLPPDSGRPTGR
jgi:hypothetical protein